MVVKKNSTKTKSTATKKGAAGKDGSYKAKTIVEQKSSASVDKDSASAAYSQKLEASVGVEGSTGNENIGASGSTTATVSIEQNVNASAGLDGNNVYVEIDAKGETYTDGKSNFPILEEKANFYLGKSIKIVNGSQIG